MQETCRYQVEQNFRSSLLLEEHKYLETMLCAIRKVAMLAGRHLLSKVIQNDSSFNNLHAALISDSFLKVEKMTRPEKDQETVSVAL